MSKENKIIPGFTDARKNPLSTIEAACNIIGGKENKIDRRTAMKVIFTSTVAVGSIGEASAFSLASLFPKNTNEDGNVENPEQYKKTALADIIKDPKKYEGQFVKVYGGYAEPNFSMGVDARLIKDREMEVPNPIFKQIAIANVYNYHLTESIDSPSIPLITGYPDKQMENVNKFTVKDKVKETEKNKINVFGVVEYVDAKDGDLKLKGYVIAPREMVNSVKK